MSPLCSQPPKQETYWHLLMTRCHLNSIFHAEVFQSIVTFKPAGLTVLVKADSDDVKVVDEDGEDVQGFAQDHVEPAPLLLELHVQVLQALKQELHLVEFAKPDETISFHVINMKTFCLLCCWSLPIEYEKWKQFCLWVGCSCYQAEKGNADYSLLLS